MWKMNDVGSKLVILRFTFGKTFHDIGKDTEVRIGELTHPAFVWAGAWWAIILYSLKYSGTDKPKNKDTPTIKRFLIEFMFVNCKKDSPTEAENINRSQLVGCKRWKRWLLKSKLVNENRCSPTKPNNTQYAAANMGKGIDANSAPNFPARWTMQVR